MQEVHSKEKHKLLHESFNWLCIYYSQKSCKKGDPIVLFLKHERPL